MNIVKGLILSTALFSSVAMAAVSIDQTPVQKVSIEAQIKDIDKDAGIITFVNLESGETRTLRYTKELQVRRLKDGQKVQLEISPKSNLKLSAI
ncbi:hypothetical protein [Agaribacterium haliotis]|uniref:hypothetical protein n=1 Tax=Agaribacterium haliotis TaxID=2013869 RepID=UPI000BB59D2D|nr:hypothetical protein [Agaribacterium haliotis]